MGLSLIKSRADMSKLWLSWGCKFRDTGHQFSFQTENLCDPHTGIKINFPYIKIKWASSESRREGNWYGDTSLVLHTTYLGNCEGRTPVVFENVKTYHALRVDVAVVNSGSEGHFRWLEGVLWSEVDVQEEDPTLVRRPWGAEDRRDPLIQIVTFRSSAKIRK